MDTELTRRIAPNLFFWEGLRWLPFGVFLVVVGLQLLSPNWSPGVAGPWLLLVLLVWSFWAESRIGRYYQRTVGTAWNIPGSHRRRTISKWLLVYPALAASLLVDSLFEPPILISSVVLAAAILLYRRSTGGGRRHYFVGAVLVAANTVLPLVGVETKNGLSILMIVLGLVYIVGGVLDHLELVRALHPIPDEET
jgi:hypothetical protein